MRYAGLALTAVLAAGSSSLLPASLRLSGNTTIVVDTVYVRAALDYDEIARRVAKLNVQKGPTTIDGDLIVKGRIGVGGAPEPNTSYPVTVHGAGDARMLFISNEALNDGQRAGTQHRHVGAIGVSHDGGLRMDQNAVCFSDSGCVVDDKRRRRAYSGYDSLGDMSFFLSDVDSASGQATAPPMQSLVLYLMAWDGSIKFTAHRPGQKIFFQGSSTPRAADLQWEVPLR